MSTTQHGRPAGRLSPLALALLVVAVLLGTTGGAVAGGLITGARIANESVTGVDIKNGTLTSADLLDEPRAWGAAKTAYTDGFTSTSLTPVVTKSLATTRAGYLTITGALYAEDDIDLEPVGRLSYSLRVDGKVVGGTRALIYNGLGDGENGALTAVVPVAKGAHTVSLVVRELGGGSFIWSANLSAVYTPVGSSSGLVLGKTVVPRTANR